MVGRPIGSFYGYIVEGVYQSYNDKLSSPVNTEFSYGPGDLKYKDINGDGKINTAEEFRNNVVLNIKDIKNNLLYK